MTEEKRFVCGEVCLWAGPTAVKFGDHEPVFVIIFKDKVPYTRNLDGVEVLLINPLQKRVFPRWWIGPKVDL